MGSVEDKLQTLLWIGGRFYANLPSNKKKRGRKSDQKKKDITKTDFSFPVNVSVPQAHFNTFQFRHLFFKWVFFPI